VAPPPELTPIAGDLEPEVARARPTAGAMMLDPVRSSSGS
jgi:hypothetical protein